MNPASPIVQARIATYDPPTRDVGEWPTKPAPASVDERSGMDRGPSP
ncbi:MAG: hypothetical protein IPK71_36390 [Myxococcales bacterium]|nr:hypothetical protein [Myxococcales bacterium]